MNDDKSVFDQMSNIEMKLCGSPSQSIYLCERSCRPVFYVYISVLDIKTEVSVRDTFCIKTTIR